MTMEQLKSAKELQEKIARANEYTIRLCKCINGLEVPKSVSETVMLEYLHPDIHSNTHQNEYRGELIELRDELIATVCNIIKKHAEKYEAAFAAL